MWQIVLASLAAVVACGNGDTGDRSATGSNTTVEQELAKIVATCAEATGVVEVRRHGQPYWDRVGVGATFRERDWVRTGPGAFARIRIIERGFVELQEDATILVDSAITIERGPIVAIASAGAEPLAVKAADGSEARISTPAGEEPAELRLTPSTDSSLEIAVTKGRAAVTTPRGNRIVATGQATDLARNETGEVVSLLGFPRSLSPGVDARFKFERGKSSSLVWAAVPEAARYHVQISRDTSFRTLVMNLDVSALTTAFVPSVAGAYAWRVAARDARGRLGELGFARRIFFEEDTPRDLLIAPRDDARYGFADTPPPIAFSWQSAGDARKYRLVIRLAADPSAPPVVSLVTEGQQVQVATLGEGSYRWGVYAVRDGVELPTFLEPRLLTIRRQRVKANTSELWK